MTYLSMMEKAKGFVRHAFKKQVTLRFGLPRILISRAAYNDMYILVDEVSDEVGWIGSVERVGRDFLIKEIFLLEQESHAATCEITAEGISKWAMELMSNRTDGMEVVNAIRFWGHSHVNMGVSPSAQDETQMTVFAESCSDFFIRGILNKSGAMEFTLYLYELGVEIQDAEWEIYEPASDDRRNFWKEEITTKVSRRIYSTYRQPGGFRSRFDDNFEELGEVGEILGLQYCGNQNLHRPVITTTKGRKKKW